jgi:hypothetical protein
MVTLMSCGWDEMARDTVGVERPRFFGGMLVACGITQGKVYTPGDNREKNTIASYYRRTPKKGS